MDTIRLSANGHDILFSKKSVMIDGEEYLYTGINAGVWQLNEWKIARSLDRA